ncbi:hypothetical protein [Phycisphaera mikurensis]|uniref:AsmA-like C-terminal domain-containing protein n=1 Tax=Phycisphaera mikurensis (strain NBRC 102666 / KCTC 22515 / FYK2301M01) TaxID=1142394 RepID=I0IGB2_PHYMF|nr:hypothetical protein [Phycisphaera mikurensis]MBB6440320.1 hypothetical protein [Phycisphaera mikurensis]BAM04300.1 hypothetical protein PSMK_21410 [Phycisphaera mikurensis NBRC 102666]
MQPPAPAPAAPEDAPARRRRWPRRLAWSALTLATLGIVAASVLTRPAVLTPLVRGQLAGALRAEVALDRATLSLGGVLTLHGLGVALPEDAVPEGEPEAAEYRRLLNLKRLTLRIGRRDLLRGRVNLERIEVAGPTLHAVLEGPEGTSNLRAWADRFRDGRPHDDDGGPVVLPPEIFVRDAALELVQLDAGGAPGGVAEVVARHRLGFDGTVIPQGTGLGAKLAFELTGRAAPGSAAAPGTEVSGSWTPARQELVLSVERMDLASPLGLLMPPAVRALWRDLDPAGALPALTLETRLDRTGTERLQRARLEVAGLSFRLPLASLELLPEGESQRDAPRMSSVSGSVVLEDGRIASDGLSGQIEGIRVRIAGSADLEEGGGVALVAETEPFEVPATPPLLFRLPGLISQIYEEYRPSGRFAARVEVTREAGGPVGIDGRVRAIDARAVFHAFPFPLQGLEGELLLDRDTLRIRGLSASGPTGGRVVLDGDITQPGPDAGIDLSIRVEDVPLDATLLAAMDPDLRERIRGFFDAASAQRLADASPEAEAPFDPGGRLRGVVRVLRDTAIRPRSWIELDLDPEGLRVMLPEFAYPLTVRSGSVRTGAEEVRLNDLVVTGPTGGAGVIRGRVGLGEADRPARIDIRLVDFSLPVDRHLLGALDADAAAWLRRLGVRGRIVGGGLVGSAAVRPRAGDPSPAEPVDAERLRLQLDLRLVDGRAGLWGNEATLTGLEAEARVTRDVLRLDRLRADWPGGGSFTGEGRIEIPSGRLRLDIEADDVRFDAAVARMIPPESPARAAALDFFATYDLSGTADGNLLLRTRDAAGDGEATLDVALDVRPTAVAARYGGRRVAIGAVTGRVAIDEDAATLAGLSGATPTGSVGVSGRVPFNEVDPAWLRIDAQGDTADPVLLAFTPAAVRDAAAGVGLGGGVRLEDATLRLGPTPADAPPDATLPFAFEGGVVLTDATATLGVPIAEAGVAARVRAVGGGAEPWPDIKLLVNAPRLLLGSRVVERLGFAGDNRDRPAVLRLRGVDASVYGGVLGGEVRVRLGDDDRAGGPPPGGGSFAVDLRLSGAEAESVLYPDEVAASPTEPAEPRIASLPPLPPPRSAGGGPSLVSPPRRATAPPEDRDRAVGGRLWAALAAAGEAGRPETLEGRGRVRIRGGDLLKGQRGIGLLRAINLALPTSEPLGDADGRFVLVDGQVRVEDAQIRGASLSLNGRGSVDLPGGELYLTFFSRVETNRWLRGIKRLFDSIKDEFIGIEVGGTLWEPDARVTGLTGLRGAVDERLGETAPPRTVPAPAVPAPGPEPEPAPTPAAVTTPPAR